MKERLVILGAGESGYGAALLGIQKGYDVFVSDRGTVEEKTKNAFNKNNIAWEEGQHTESKILNADLVVKSPGIPDTAELIVKLNAAGIPVISEIEFASRYTDANLIAVTGSNGKTTVVSLLSWIFDGAGLNFILAGNVGYSFAQRVAMFHPDYYILEVSSFQLDGIVDFHPHIAVLTNITPDHLDRYNHNFKNYIDAKFRITENQTEEDYFIYDADDKVIAEELKTRKIRARKIPFSFTKFEGDGSFCVDNTITTTFNNQIFTMPIDELQIQGDHNMKNAMAASTASSLVKIRREQLREKLSTFQGVEHRLEKVLKIRNVQYINDSKATNVNSTYYALQTVGPNTIWIVGGEDKGNDYSELLPFVHEKVKAIICLGLDNQKIIDSFDKSVDVMVEARSMNDAVQLAYRIAEEGDTVLLSPACASFDLFENYEDRGRQFKAAVRSL